ncbi:MAG: hypothetical protein VKP70_03580 [Cyanobacteriota bacterium]|nr:hypothetical protein [Cyanobacteriota bacterium]
MNSVFLSGAHPAEIIGKGFFAGLKSRNGLPTPLPVQLTQEDVFVNAGYLDGLSAAFCQRLQVRHAYVRIELKGSASLQFYFLDALGKIRHYSDRPLLNPLIDSAPRIHDVPIPEVLLLDQKVRVIFFKLEPLSSPGDPHTPQVWLNNWCFHAELEHLLTQQTPLPLVSRSLGESPSLIRRHLRHAKHYFDLRRTHGDLLFAEMPRLYVYESDPEACHLGRQLINKAVLEYPALKDMILLQENPFNLGGGGNMCLAIKEIISDQNHDGWFAMVDSDTLVPFKTLYSSALLNAVPHLPSNKPIAISPVILFEKNPTMVLEAGAVFGRGTWQLAVNKPVQPCIFPIQNGRLLTNMEEQARLSKDTLSDYPPFIFSLYSLPRDMDGKQALPAPFFLRGDDIEFGYHLASMGVTTTVMGSLVVFQDPKHSLWHELMAILHAVVILCAYTSPEGLTRLSDHLHSYFQSRLTSHLSFRDLGGAGVYLEVLSRLNALKTFERENLLASFYDPAYYLRLRSLNQDFTHSTYTILRDTTQSLPPETYVELPFLYYPQHPSDKPLPMRIGFINHLAETAFILEPHTISHVDVRVCRDQGLRELTSLLADLDEIRERCLLLLDRQEIYKLYQQTYTTRPHMESFVEQFSS